MTQQLHNARLDAVLIGADSGYRQTSAEFFQNNDVVLCASFLNTASRPAQGRYKETCLLLPVLYPLLDSVITMNQNNTLVLIHACWNTQSECAATTKVR
jgi:hypothetical protein